MQITHNGHMVIVKLDNGTTIQGTRDQVQATLNMMGITAPMGNDGIHYYSTSAGHYLTIKTMTTPHIENAVRKALRVWVESLKNVSAEQLVDALRKGAAYNDITLRALVAELQSRV